jgi:mutator protein MutT
MKTFSAFSKKKIVEVGVACIYKDGKYLVQSRPFGKSFPGSWEFPGGKRNCGESFKNCVKREIREELGINIYVQPAFHEIICNFQSVQLKLVFHIAKIKDGKPQPLEKQALKWVTVDEFDNVNFLKTNAEALEELKKIEKL